MEQNKKQTYFSLFLSFISFFVNYSVNFFITPYVSAYLPGTYGYVKIANDVISYASLITIALDSMASRFISLEYNKGNEEKAKKTTVSYVCEYIYCSNIEFTNEFYSIKFNKLIQIPIKI
jgi:Na+-driven multidrug efflux pump